MPQLPAGLALRDPVPHRVGLRAVVGDRGPGDDGRDPGDHLALDLLAVAAGDLRRHAHDPGRARLDAGLAHGHGVVGRAARRRRCTPRRSWTISRPTRITEYCGRRRRGGCRARPPRPRRRARSPRGRARCCTRASSSSTSSAGTSKSTAVPSTCSRPERGVRRMIVDRRLEAFGPAADRRARRRRGPRGAGSRTAIRRSCRRSAMSPSRSRVIGNARRTVTVRPSRSAAPGAGTTRSNSPRRTVSLAQQRAHRGGAGVDRDAATVDSDLHRAAGAGRPGASRGPRPRRVASTQQGDHDVAGPGQSGAEAAPGVRPVRPREPVRRPAQGAAARPG